MKKALVLIADGSEEIETLTPVDVLRRASVEVDLTSISQSLTVTCSRGVKVVADKLLNDIDFNDYDCIVVPGGMPGATNIANCKDVIEGLKNTIQNGKIVASICASPAVVLGANGLIKGRKATCFPADEFIDILKENYTGDEVTVDGNLITANGPKSALDFSLEICRALKVEPRI